MALIAAMLVATGAGPADGEAPPRSEAEATGSAATNPHRSSEDIRANRPAELESSPAASALPPRDAVRTAQTVALFGLISLAPVAVLMVTAFVRINIVLVLLRQALGSPQVPGNQVLTALALLLTALVMHRVGDRVYREAIRPYATGQASASAAWAAGARPIKSFMVDQIERTGHPDYLRALYEYAVPPSEGRVEASPTRGEDLPLRVVAPAYLLSELTTALKIGFYLYLPFLVIDLVVSAVLAATGLFMLPPALVATPVKLILFVLADGWIRVSMMLLSSFDIVPSGG
jgi:flagellar biosynthetic protein FliP